MLVVGRKRRGRGTAGRLFGRWGMGGMFARDAVGVIGGPGTVEVVGRCFPSWSLSFYPEKTSHWHLTIWDGAVTGKRSSDGNAGQGRPG